MALIAAKATEKRTPGLLSDEILQKLKCAECGGFLSTPPVLKHPQLGSACGLCSPFVAAAGYVRNAEYEALAACVAFPCRNAGCHKRVPFGAGARHEHTCAFRRYECPLNAVGALACPWTGHSQQLCTHFGEQHPQCLVLNKTFAPELRRNAEQSRLLLADSNLFLVQTKCSVAARKFWCLVRYVGPPERSALFRYRVELVGNKASNSYVSGEKPTQSDICMLMEQSVALEIDIGPMLAKLNCPHNIECVLHVRRIY